MAKKVVEGSFGAIFRQLREKEGLTIEDLAAQVGMKPAYLKNLEEGEILPPVAEIITLARTLSVEPSVFMGGPSATVSPVKRRKALATRTSDYAYETLTGEEQEKHLMAFRVTIDAKSAHRKVGYQHEGEEFIYVLAGRLKITVAGKSKTLGPNESIHFDSGLRHHLFNPGRTPTVLVVSLYVP